MVLRNFTVKRLVPWCAAGVAALALAGAPASAWEFAHGDRDNSGFANVTTAPAGKGSVTVPGLGTFRPGAGPVIAPDGTVYLGTAQGKLIALHADGKSFWSRDITRGQSIVASPAVASDGSIYVIGVEHVRDNRVDPPKATMISTLHVFNSTGAWLAQIPFPDHGEVGPAAVAPPNIGRFGGTEAIIVPVLYGNRFGGHEIRLIAFSLTGQVLDDERVAGFAQEVYGGSGMDDWQLVLCFVPVPFGCFMGVDFNPRPFRPLLDVAPLPGVAIATGARAPLILVSDHRKDLIGYSFANQQFREVFRLNQADFFMQTSPVILPGGLALIGLEKFERNNIGVPGGVGVGRLILVPPNGQKIGRVDGFESTMAAPTRLSDGRIVLVGELGKVTVVKSNQTTATLQAPGQSVTSAAASRTHFFVSAENGFVTYDAATLAEVSRIDWVGGGLNPPAIGPKGHVYAIASNILFVFPPPIKKPFTVVNQPQGGLPVATDPGSGTPPSEKSYKPPMTANGNRLFACEELDGDDCGNGDHREIAKAFCAKQGYVAADDLDVDSEKVKAETLDGRFCSKNKCKVFDQIVCKM